VARNSQSLTGKYLAPALEPRNGDRHASLSQPAEANGKERTPSKA